ncbi:hypothetical protein [Fibrobacter succinogenes]|uniref:hypothetical protein n=1 Tax=Fibrobacter succinogenes TaxID=833 RepID=UPI0015633D95|nr:hypothetical protein [Fibrobacter succinogenes]
MRGSRICILIVVAVSLLFAVDAFVLPSVTPELKAKASEYYNNECKGCHRWARKFAAPPMKDNVVQYAEDPQGLVRYLMKPGALFPEQIGMRSCIYEFKN